MKSTFPCIIPLRLACIQNLLIFSFLSIYALLRIFPAQKKLWGVEVRKMTRYSPLDDSIMRIFTLFYLENPSISGVCRTTLNHVLRPKIPFLSPENTSRYLRYPYMTPRTTLKKSTKIMISAHILLYFSLLKALRSQNT